MRSVRGFCIDGNPPRLVPSFRGEASLRKNLWELEQERMQQKFPHKTSRGRGHHWTMTEETDLRQGDPTLSIKIADKKTSTGEKSCRLKTQEAWSKKTIRGNAPSLLGPGGGRGNYPNMSFGNYTSLHSYYWSEKSVESLETGAVLRWCERNS